jgi:hypothetical protein
LGTHIGIAYSDAVTIAQSIPCPRTNAGRTNKLRLLNFISTPISRNAAYTESLLPGQKSACSANEEILDERMRRVALDHDEITSAEYYQSGDESGNDDDDDSSDEGQGDDNGE